MCSKMIEHNNRHYIVVDASGRVVDGWCDGASCKRNVSGAILLTERGSYQFRLFPGGEENPRLTDQSGIPLYRWDGLMVCMRSQEELENDRATLPVSDTAPTVNERLEALETALLAIMKEV